MNRLRAMKNGVHIAILQRLYRMRSRRVMALVRRILGLYNRVNPSANSVALNIHVLYMSNRLAEAVKLSQLMLLAYSDSQAFLHNALKVAWLSQDKNMLRALSYTIADARRTSYNNAYFLSQRKGMDPEIEVSAKQISSRELARLTLMKCCSGVITPQVEEGIRIVTSLEDRMLSDHLLKSLIAKFPRNPELLRLAAKKKSQDEDWLNAYADLSTALESATVNDDTFNMISEAALYFVDAPERVQKILTMRANHGVKTAGFDKVRALDRLLDGDLIDYIRLRGAQLSNLVADRVYGKRTSISMGLRVTPFLERRESLFVIGRDGVADEVRWSQYYPGLLRYYNNISISCDPRLQQLFERSFPGINFYPVSRNWGRTIGPELRAERDRVPAMDLATRLDNVSFHKSLDSAEVSFIEDIAVRSWLTSGNENSNEHDPNCAKYLQPRKDRTAYWATRFSRILPVAPRIGIVWRSGLQDIDRNRHYLDLKDFEVLSRLPVSLISLQHQINASERNTGEKMGVYFFDDEIDFYNDFEEIAALSSSLDVIIGISTLSFELAAAVGTPAWMCAVSPLGKWLRLSDPDCSGPDRLTRNGRVYIPETEGGYLAKKSLRVDSIMTQIVSEIERTLLRPLKAESSEVKKFQ